MSAFLKEEYLKSRSFAERADILYAVLEDGKEYDREEVCKLINEYMGKELA